MRITRKVFINRNLADVFGYLTSPATEPRWRRTVLESAFDEPGDLLAGSRGWSRIRFMGREVNVPWEIVEFVDEVRLCRKYSSGVRGGRDRYVLEPFGLGTTILKVEVEVEAAGLAGLLATGRRSWMERELRADLNRLKQIIEAT